MGYAARFATADPTTGAWQGELRPDVVDLGHLFRLLPGLELAALSDPVTAEAAWRRVLPLNVELVALLGPAVAWLRFPEPAEAREVVVKCVRPSGDRGLVGLLRRFLPSRAQRAHLAAHRLRALGLPAPRPLGVLEHVARPRSRPSFVAYEHLPGKTLLSRAAELVGPASSRERRLLITRVAALYRGLHDAGIFHADLHAGNLIVSGDAIVPIDLVSLRRLSLPGRAVVKNLARLNRDFLDARALSKSDRLRFLAAYLKGVAGARERLHPLFRAVWAETQKKLSQYGGTFRSARTSAYDALDAPTLVDPVSDGTDDERGPPSLGGP